MFRPILQTLAAFVIAAFSLAGCQREKAPATPEAATVSSPSVDPAAELSRAHDGDARAQLHVGLLYLRGEGVPQDYREARFWIEKAARQGLADAQTRLGTLYRDGTGSAPDTTLMQAARLAAYYSKARNSSQVPVDYTAVKNVKKPNGAKPGMVIYDHYNTVYVLPSAAPDEE